MTIRFGAFTLNRDTRQLTREGAGPETFVDEANLSNLVAEIREALGDQARSPRFIRTARIVALADRNLTRIGSLLLSFHVRAPFGSTDTQTEAFS